MPVGDLTQRLARDASLDAYWDDGTRRRYWLRARGRVLEDSEKLDDLGVVPFELIHLLPEPPKGSQVIERIPDYPKTRGYAAAGIVNIAMGVLTIFAWTTAWAVALTVDQRPAIGLLPGVALGLITTSVARHLWGGHGGRVRIPFTGLVIFAAMASVVFLPMWQFVQLETQHLVLIVAMGFMGGMAGVIMAWLAWFGAVEPLPARSQQEVVKEQVQLQYPCAICGGPVTDDVKIECSKSCGRVFHLGCYRTRQQMGHGSVCPCGG
jgi:hypothetical protein